LPVAPRLVPVVKQGAHETKERCGFARLDRNDLVDVLFHMGADVAHCLNFTKQIEKFGGHIGGALCIESVFLVAIGQFLDFDIEGPSAYFAEISDSSLNATSRQHGGGFWALLEYGPCFLIVVGKGLRNRRMHTGNSHIRVYALLVVGLDYTSP
jgi:hypothetical protein